MLLEIEGREGSEPVIMVDEEERSRRGEESDREELRRVWLERKGKYDTKQNVQLRAFSLI